MLRGNRFRMELLVLAAVAAGLAACDVGRVTFTEDGQSRLSTTSMAVTVRLRPADSAAANALGWPARRVPGTQLTLARESRSGIDVSDARTAETDSAGTAVFEGLSPEATYRLSGERALTSSERSTVSSVNRALLHLAGGRKATRDSVTLELRRNRADGLVISELSYRQPREGPEYDHFGFVEVYNNSAETVYLDGRVIGAAYTTTNNYQGTRCAGTRDVRTDTTGLWARFFQAFPGSGQEHPLPPGEAAVIATDAIDHTEVGEEFLDLRDADFEFRGGPDNPSVPDMRRVGLQPWFGGHGLNTHVLGGADYALFLSAPVDVASLERGRPSPISDDPYVKIPAGSVEDVTTSVWAAPTIIFRRYCSQVLAPQFDRLAFAYIDPSEVDRSVQRRPAGTAEGRTILLDTNTSAVDFRWGPRTPGSVPE